MQKRLAFWKNDFFFVAGRLTLIKFVLSDILVHYFSLFRAWYEVCKCLERLMRDFLWEGIDEWKEKGLHLIRWEVNEKLMSLGGLEIGNLRIYNKTHLAKWLWCFTSKSNSLWRRIIVSKHGPHPLIGCLKGLKVLTRTCGKTS